MRAFCLSIPIAYACDTPTISG